MLRPHQIKTLQIIGIKYPTAGPEDMPKRFLGSPSPTLNFLYGWFLVLYYLFYSILVHILLEWPMLLLYGPKIAWMKLQYPKVLFEVQGYDIDGNPKVFAHPPLVYIELKVMEILDQLFPRLIKKRRNPEGQAVETYGTSGNYQTQAGYKWEWPGFADRREEWFVRKGYIRKTYYGIGIIAFLISSIYFYNLKPTKDLPKSQVEEDYLVASVCAQKTNLDIKKGDQEFKTFFVPYAVIDHGCDKIERNIRDVFFIEYKEGHLHYSNQRPQIDSLCRSTCTTARTLYPFIVKTCGKDKACIQKLFTRAKSVYQANGEADGLLNELVKVMKENPAKAKAIYDRIIRE